MMPAAFQLPAGRAMMTLRKLDILSSGFIKFSQRLTTKVGKVVWLRSVELEAQVVILYLEILINGGSINDGRCRCFISHRDVGSRVKYSIHTYRRVKLRLLIFTST